MQTKREWLTGAALFGAALLVVLSPYGADLHASQSGSQADEPVPAYHTQPPVGALPDTLDPARFDNPVTKNAYALAGKVKKVLYQQPCYCHCDRALGHNSLHSCFEDTHGAACSTCMREAVYAYQQTQNGKTPAQIRAGIERGEWQDIDLEKAAL